MRDRLGRSILLRNPDMPRSKQRPADPHRRSGRKSPATHRSDLRSATARDLATLAGTGSPLLPADRASIANIYALDLRDSGARVQDSGKPAGSRFCA